MRQVNPGLDVVARRVIRASEEGLRRWTGAQQLDNDLLGALYLRVRDVLKRDQWDDETVEDVTLTIYLTVSAWHSCDDSPLEFLSSLHQVIANTLTSDSPVRRMQ